MRGRFGEGSSSSSDSRSSSCKKSVKKETISTRALAEGQIRSNILLFLISFSFGSHFLESTCRCYTLLETGKEIYRSWTASKRCLLIWIFLICLNMIIIVTGNNQVSFMEKEPSDKWLSRTTVLL